MDRYKAVVGVFTGILVAGCAGSATHDVVSPYQASDGDLSCSQIKSEMMKAQFVIDGVNKDKEDLTAADITDGILWFPFNLIAKDVNYRDSLEAGNKRIARLTELEKEKNCSTVAAEASEEPATNVAAQQERELSGPEITLVHAGNTLDAFKSENGQLIKSDNKVKFGANGTMSGSTKAGQSDTGKWWVEENKICRKWRQWQKAATGCYTITLAGNRVRWVQDDGRTHGVLRLREVPATLR